MPSSVHHDVKHSHKPRSSGKFLLMAVGLLVIGGGIATGVAFDKYRVLQSDKSLAREICNDCSVGQSYTQTCIENNCQGKRTWTCNSKLCWVDGGCRNLVCSGGGGGGGGPSPTPNLVDGEPCPNNGIWRFRNGQWLCTYGGTLTCSGVVGGGGDPCRLPDGTSNCATAGMLRCRCCGDSFVGVRDDPSVANGIQCDEACTGVFGSAQCDCSSTGNCESSNGVTPTPTISKPPPPPNLAGQCINTGTSPYSGKVSWSPVAGATFYALRVDYSSNGVPLKNCATPTAPDFCTNVTGTSYSFRLPASPSTVSWWVHSCNNSGCGNAAYGPVFDNISCPGTTIPPKATPTPTRPPGTSSACSYFAIDENSGTDSQLVKINIAQFGAPSTSVSLIKTYPCSTGVCDLEAMDADNSGQLYVISNKSKSLYKVSKSTGALTKVASLAYNIISMSFRKSDNSLWAFVPGKGIYTVNTATGAMTLKASSTLSYVDGMAWDSSSAYLYMSRTPLRDGADAHLIRYRESGGIDTSFDAKLPFDTDGLDSMPGIALLGAYKSGSGKLNVYRFIPSTKTVHDSYSISTPHTNIDALTACVPN